ncbi:sensor histidine kinase [Arenibaculum pallidiluteum]|uniref:sensor histidine kinase n=1 Tax=Arenibaculum pallidiluteum TaxID=2812559 RepID=UPI001A96E635|nr:ATP-binding protein [Arenibaculum pallidiluteum]
MIDRRLLRTTAFRVALIYAALLFATVAVALGAVYYATAGTLDAQTDETIAAEIDGLREQYRQRGVAGLAQVLRGRSARQRTSSLYLLTDPFGRPLAGNLSAWPAAAPDREGWIAFPLYDAPPEETAPDEATAHPARARIFLLPEGHRLLVGRDLRERQRFVDRFAESVLWAFALTLGLGTAGGVLLGRRVLRRIDGVRRTAARIMAGELDQRLALSGSGDEIDQVAANLNAMLDRIEALMGEMRHVAEGVAHDLRTPLNRLRSRLELGLMEVEASDPARVALEDALEEAEGLLGTFQALLAIAEVEAGHQQTEFAPFDLAALAREVAELYEPLAEQAGLRIAAELRPATVRGHRQLVAQALANLVDNAVKYTPPGGTVSIRTGPGERPGDAVLTVADTGQGIPEEERVRVLRRFVRLEGSRSAPGNGLGLSLVDAVARLHGAALELGDAQPGLVATLRFPVAAVDGAVHGTADGAATPA